MGDSKNVTNSQKGVLSQLFEKPKWQGGNKHTQN